MMIPFSKPVKPSGSTKLRNPCQRLLLVTIPEIQGGVLEDMAGSKLHPSLLPNHRSSREDQSEWAHSIRVWSSILSHRLMQKRSHLRKHPVNSRHSSTNGRTEANPSSSSWAKTTQGSPGLFFVGNNSSGATFKSEGFISLRRKEIMKPRR